MWKIVAGCSEGVALVPDWEVDGPGSDGAYSLSLKVFFVEDGISSHVGNLRAAVFPGRHSLDIMSISVKEAFRRRGFGTRILGFLVGLVSRRHWDIDEVSLQPVNMFWTKFGVAARDIGKEDVRISYSWFCDTQKKEAQRQALCLDT